MKPGSGFSVIGECCAKSSGMEIILADKSVRSFRQSLSVLPGRVFLYRYAGPAERYGKTLEIR
jgi:hypothetical protein